MIPQGATHKIKEQHKDGAFADFIKVGDSFAESCYSGRWIKDKTVTDFICFYDELDSKVETPEEKECLDAIEMRNACNESIAK